MYSPKSSARLYLKSHLTKYEVWTFTGVYIDTNLLRECDLLSASHSQTTQMELLFRQNTFVVLSIVSKAGLLHDLVYDFRPVTFPSDRDHVVFWFRYIMYEDRR